MMDPYYVEYTRSQHPANQMPLYYHKGYPTGTIKVKNEHNETIPDAEVSVDESIHMTEVNAKDTPDNQEGGYFRNIAAGYPFVNFGRWNYPADYSYAPYAGYYGHPGYYRGFDLRDGSKEDWYNNFGPYSAYHAARYHPQYAQTWQKLYRKNGGKLSPWTPPEPIDPIYQYLDPISVCL